MKVHHIGAILIETDTRPENRKYTRKKILVRLFSNKRTEIGVLSTAQKGAIDRRA